MEAWLLNVLDWLVGKPLKNSKRNYPKSVVLKWVMSKSLKIKIISPAQWMCRGNGMKPLKSYKMIVSIWGQSIIHWTLKLMIKKERRRAYTLKLQKVFEQKTEKNNTLIFGGVLLAMTSIGLLIFVLSYKVFHLSWYDSVYK